MDNKIEMAKKPGKKQKENPVGCTGESKRGNIREGKTGTVMELEFKGEVTLVRFLYLG